MPETSCLNVSLRISDSGFHWNSNHRGLNQSVIFFIDLSRQTIFSSFAPFYPKMANYVKIVDRQLRKTIYRYYSVWGILVHFCDVGTPRKTAIVTFYFKTIYSINIISAIDVANKPYIIICKYFRYVGSTTYFLYYCHQE